MPARTNPAVFLILFKWAGVGGDQTDVKKTADFVKAFWHKSDMVKQAAELLKWHSTSAMVMTKKENKIDPYI